jgi:hypothetical protein
MSWYLPFFNTVDGINLACAAQSPRGATATVLVG